MLTIPINDRVEYKRGKKERVESGWEMERERKRDNERVRKKVRDYVDVSEKQKGNGNTFEN